MGMLESIKPFWPLLFTFILPRALSYYRALKVAYRTRPPPRPLSAKATRSLNILFVSACVFLWLSLSFNDPWSQQRNIFAETKSRLNLSTDTLFSRLALHRPHGVLTRQDEELKSHLTTIPLRQIYLRHGPNTLINCPFCHPDQPLTYTLHSLPTAILLPYLLHLLTLGLATSTTLTTHTISTLRLKSLLLSLALLAIDLYITTLSEPPPSHPPRSLHAIASIVRPLVFLAFDLALAFIVYITFTGRFVFFPFLATAEDQTDPREMLEQTERLIGESSVALQMAQMKLRGLNVARNAVVRDESLRRTDERYWEVVRRVEREGGPGADRRGEDGTGGTGMDDSVFEDEEVQAAMARAFGSGNVDVQKMRGEAQGFVDNVTKGLD